MIVLVLRRQGINGFLSSEHLLTQLTSPDGTIRPASKRSLARLELENEFPHPLSSDVLPGKAIQPMLITIVNSHQREKLNASFGGQGTFEIIR